MKVYKFRSLNSELEFYRVREIITNGEFWHSHFPDLNDPREGAFTFFSEKENLPFNVSDLIYSEKQKLGICSFSGEEGFRNPLLWGYYAGGFRGVAIEIEPAEERPLKPVKYESDITHLAELKRLMEERSGVGVDWKEMANEILSAKLLPWKHEVEYRSIQDEKGMYSVGKITAIYFGKPYGNADNKDPIYKNSSSLSQYESYVKKLKEIIAETIPCYDVVIKDCLVEKVK